MQTMNYIRLPCLFLCVSSIAAVLFISSICLRQMLVLWIKQPVFSSNFYPAIPKSNPFHTKPDLPQMPNCQVPKGEIKKTWKFLLYNLCILLKHMKTLFFKYTQWYIDIFILLKSIMHLLYVWSFSGNRKCKEEQHRVLTLNGSYPDEQNQSLNMW